MGEFGNSFSPLYYLFNLLGRINHSQGKYEESEASFRRAISVATNAFGSQNLLVASTNANLASMYVDAGRYSDAEVLFLRSIGIEDTLAPDSAERASALNGLGTVYLAQEKYPRAMPVFEKAAGVFAKVVGIK